MLIFLMHYLQGVMDQLCEVDPNLLQEIEADVCEIPLMCSPAFKQLADKIVQDVRLSIPWNIHQAFQLYFALVQVMDVP